jgi:hypothetical protein
VRFRWFTVLAATTVVLGIGAQAASAKIPPSQMSRFHAVEAAFSGPQTKWTDALEALGAKATVAQVSKPCLAFIPALKAFDTGLLKVGLTGKTAADAAAIVNSNKQLIVLMSSIHSVKSFETGFSALFAKDLSLQQAFAKDIGIPAGDVYI